MLGEGFDHLVAIELESKGFHDDSFEVSTEQALLLPWIGPATVEHHRADTRSDFEKAAGGEGGDDALGRIGVDSELASELANRRKTISRAERSAENGPFHCVDDLIVNGCSRSQMNVEWQQGELIVLVHLVHVKYGASRRHGNRLPDLR